MSHDRWNPLDHMRPSKSADLNKLTLAGVLSGLVPPTLIFRLTGPAIGIKCFVDLFLKVGLDLEANCQY